MDPTKVNELALAAEIDGSNDADMRRVIRNARLAQHAAFDAFDAAYRKARLARTRKHADADDLEDLAEEARALWLKRAAQTESALREWGAL